MTVSPPEIWDPNLEGESSLSQNTQYRLCNLGEQGPGWASGQSGISYLSLSQ